ncbi:MAG: PHP domain-containing protein [Candidatus Omnitrophota bacterium]
MKYADLHIHTKFSDGTFEPAEIVTQARQAGLDCIAITDHDSVDAIAPALSCALCLNIEVIPGIELTCEMNDCEIHILGYCIDWQTRWFRDKLEQIRRVRRDRAGAIIKKLQAVGINLDGDKLLEETKPATAIGRLHIARMLEREGFVSSIKEAFFRYIGEGKSCYVKKYKLTPKEAITMINRLNGLSVLAHPHKIGSDSLILEFARLGLRGIEGYYPEYNADITEHYQRIAQKHGLLVTGGSDYHGLGESRTALGGVQVPYICVEKLKAEAAARKNQNAAGVKK